MARNIRVNQSHFAMIPQANIRRSVFDRSHVYKTTFNEGQLIPYFVDEVIPGDTFKIEFNIKEEMRIRRYSYNAADRRMILNKLIGQRRQRSKFLR